MKAGIKRRRAKGKAWGEPPQGYLVEHKVVDGDPVTGRAIDPEATPIIEALFAELDTGATTGAVARRLNPAGYRTKRGHPFNARRVRAMAENDDYKGAGAYPLIIEPELWDRVNEKIRRADPASVQHARGGREPLADFMLRRLVWCAGCGEPAYSIVHHGKRLYRCKAALRYTGTCEAPPIPADLVGARPRPPRVVPGSKHRDVDRGAHGGTVRRAGGAPERCGRQAAPPGAPRCSTREAVGRDRGPRHHQPGRLRADRAHRETAERKSLQRDIDDAEAVLAEWTAKINADGVLDWYARIRDLVGGRIAKADGVAEINAALHDSLMGVWLAYDGETLTADIKVKTERPARVRPPRGRAVRDDALPGGVDRDAQAGPPRRVH